MDGEALLIGWGVGGWDCDRNARNRDTVVVLDADRDILGQPWRRNLRRTINASGTTDDWIAGLLDRWTTGAVRHRPVGAPDRGRARHLCPIRSRALLP